MQPCQQETHRDQHCRVEGRGGSSGLTLTTTPQPRQGGEVGTDRDLLQRGKASQCQLRTAFPGIVRVGNKPARKQGGAGARNVGKFPSNQAPEIAHARQRLKTHKQLHSHFLHPYIRGCVPWWYSMTLRPRGPGCTFPLCQELVV